MTDRRRNALIGLFVLGGLLSLAVLIVLFGESRGLFQRRYVVKAKFDHKRVPNIRQGTDVNLAGVWVGNVADVELVDAMNPSKGLFALLEIDEKFSVPKGSRARVVVPLMGQPQINIVPPGETEVPPEPVTRDGTAEIYGEVTNPLESVIDPMLIATLNKTTVQIGELAEALTPAAKAITGLLEKRTIEEVEAPDAAIRGFTANLYTTVERLHNVLKHVDTVLGDPDVQSNLKLTLENLREASSNAKLATDGFRQLSQDGRKTMASVQATVGKLDDTVTLTQEHIDRLGKSLADSTDKLSRLLDYFLAAGQQVAEGDGTVGMLLRDPKFYDELMLTTQRLGAAAFELQVLIKQWQKEGLLGMR